MKCYIFGLLFEGWFIVGKISFWIINGSFFFRGKIIWKWNMKKDISSVINTIYLINLFLLPCDLTELDLEVINRWCPYGQQPWKIGKINQNIYQVDMLFLWKERLTSSQNYTELDILFDKFSTLFIKILWPFLYSTEPFNQ